MAIRSKDVVVVLALASAASYATWLWARHTFELGSSWSDGSQAYESVGGDKIRYAVWDHPEPLPESLDEGEGATRPALSPDGRWLVYSVGERGLNADLFIAELPNGLEGRPAEPRPLATLNSAADELAPAFGPDGLYFATDRSGTGKLDIWRARFEGGTFAEPEPLPRGVNSGADETDPFPLPDGGLLFASDRPRAAREDYDLYRARRVLEVTDPPRDYRVEPLDALNTPFDEREPAATTDGRALVFASNRDGTRGGFDLFRSFAEDDQWLPPAALHGVNTASSERGPLPSPDGFALLFDRARSGELASLWRARSRELFRVPGPPVGWREILILGALLLLALLAWLAQRWKTLEIIYKCFLVSMIAHLLLMYWLQGVVPESEPTTIAGNDRVFRVRLAASQGAASADQERGGELQTERSARAEEAPARLAAATRSLTAADVQTIEAAVEALAAQPAPSPERGEVDASSAASSAARERASETQLADREARSAPMTGEAPTLALVARQSGAERASVTAGDPTRVRQAPAPTATAADLRPGQSNLDVDRTAAAPASGDAPDARDLAAPGRSDPTATAELALAQPQETFETQSGAAAPFALPDVATGELERSRDAEATQVGRFESDASEDEARFASALAAQPNDAREAEAPSRPDATTPQAARAHTEAPTTELPLVAVRSVAEAPSPTARTEAPAPQRFDPLQDLTPTAATRPVVSMATPTPARFDAPRDPLLRTATETAPRPLDPTPATRTITLGPPPVAPIVDDRPKRLEQTPYKNRFGDEKLRALEEFGGGVETERAVAAGLAYLAEIQRDRGYWGNRNDYDDKYEDVRIGKTALCLLAFLGAGHTPASGTEFTPVTQRAIDFLLGELDRDSGHFGECSSYGHGIATYALAECYALTKEPILRRPLERAVGHILDNQETRGDRRTRGGWGYYYANGRVWNGDRWPRVSVTAWQVMALESARIGGIDVPDEAFELARSFLAGAWDEERGAFRYSHDPNRLRSGYPILPASTPAALFGLSLLGVDLQSPELREARQFVTSRRPRAYRYEGDDNFVYRARGNLYFWYYGTLAMFRAGGSSWSRWNAAMKDTLLDAQDHNGSWEPISIYARFAGDDDADRSYTTAMCVLTLEVYYRYFTPLLQVR